MKKIFYLSVILLCLSASNSFSQNRHRLTGGEPYDVFLSFRGHYLITQDNFKDNYQWGAGGDFQVEFQYQEVKLSWGVSLGYDRFQPESAKIQYLPTKQNFAAWQVPLTVFCNYYFFNEKIKPYVGIGLGAVYGRYDFSLSKENFNDYYYRDFEGQSGIKFGYMPRVGCMFSLNHKNGFGLEFGMQSYFKNKKLEKQTTFSATLQYTYIID
ncbi:MAG: hypothetical protein SPK52_04010 [Synergistales bacterium]|nr:hypothetical protein [Bacteroidales bacterium]MDY6423530.1 hypothetical protein [Bacteroidales bacterium]MDY6435363.1 hypothetical protein [Synergistales bacterium]